MVMMMMTIMMKMIIIAVTRSIFKLGPQDFSGKKIQITSKDIDDDDDDNNNDGDDDNNNN